MRIISSLFKNKERWPSCKHPRTLSYRATVGGGALMEDMFKTVNSIFIDPPETSTPDTSEEEEEEYLNTVVRAAMGSSEKTRLFFEPGSSDTRSILEETKPVGFAFKESVVLAMESEDPYLDFKRSMEEMVESHGGVKDWDCLEELLGWYLRVNGKKHHKFIVGAFVDLLVGIASNSNSSSASSSSCCSTSSSSVSPLNNPSSSSSSRCNNCSDSASFASAISCFSSSGFSSPLVGSSSLQKIITGEVEEEAV